MTVSQPPEILKLLAHDVRWSLVQALQLSDYRVQELVEQLNSPMNLVSYHLKLLREAGIVTMHKSEADGRDVYYTLEHTVMRRLIADAALALNPAFKREARQALDVPLRVLFVCTHNSARSQMAEALLRTMGDNQFVAFSAGNEPSGVHPDTVRTMQAMHIDISGQQAKHWGVYAGEQFDYVISVCDRAREICPVFPGGQLMHWSFPDPAAIGESTARTAAFVQTAERLRMRIDYFLNTLHQQDAA